MGKISTDQAYQRIKNKRTKKRLTPEQISKPVISGKAAIELITTMKFHENVQAKAQSSSMPRVIR